MKKDVNVRITGEIKSEVIVVGGGPAGISAALAAAREGVNTTLIEQYGFLGGMATAGLVGPFMTSYDTKGENQIVKGNFELIINRMKEYNGVIHPSKVDAESPYSSFIKPAHHNVTPFDPEVFKYVAEKILIEYGVNIIYHTRLIDVINDKNGNVKELILAGKEGAKLAAGEVYIDATGDGDLGAFAGNDYFKGRDIDDKMQPATMFMRICNVDDEKVEKWVRENPDKKLFENLVSEARENGDFPEDLSREKVGIYKQPREGEWRVNTSRILGIDGTKTNDLTEAEIKGRKQAFELMGFFREYCPGLENAILLETGHQVGIRETRRLKGEYKLRKEDVQFAKEFQDSIGKYSFFMDIHNPDGSGQEEKERLFIEKGRYFEIPYRSLLPKDVNNLLMSGRCISCDRQAFGAIRVMPACFVTGQAAGVSSALCIKNKKSPKEIEVDNLQNALKSQSCAL